MEMVVNGMANKRVAAETGLSERRSRCIAST